LVFRIGMENGKVKQNPAAGIKHRRENNVRVRYLNQYKLAKTDLAYLRNCQDEESRLVAVIGKKYPFHLPEFTIALHTGMRLSEQYRTEWSDIDFERKLLTIPRSKSDKKRHIPLNSLAVSAFQKLLTISRSKSGKKRNTPVNSAAVSVFQRVLPSTSKLNFVFLDMDGKEVLQSNKHWFDDAVAEAGIKDFTWHCLRHTFASRLTMAGVDIRTVQELMGHSSITVTMRYAHLAPAHLRAAVEKLVPPTDTRTDTRGKRPVRSDKKNAA
jgi:site-specific recombinase XerD